MVKFLDRLFGRDNLEAPAVMPTRNDEKFTAEVHALKMRRFYTALEEYIGRPLQGEERELVVQALDPKTFENMVGEEIGSTAKMVAENFGWSGVKSEWEPGEDIFTPMAPITRQKNFERGLAEYLGRAPSKQELARARQEFLREDEATKKRFGEMVGEELAAYAKDLAIGLGWAPGHEAPLAPGVSPSQRAAAK